MIKKQWFFQKVLPWLVLLLILILSIWLYSHSKQTRLFKIDDLVLFDNANDIQAIFLPYWQSLKKETEPTIRIVYFWQAYCPCDASVLPHYQQMIKQYADQPVEFLFVDLTEIDKPYSTPFEQSLNHHLISQLKSVITHTPSVAIWNGDLQLAYYGPHSLGAICNAETSFVNKAIDSLLNGINSANTNTLAEGCFCRLQRS
jgi:hypothetical protein